MLSRRARRAATVELGGADPGRCDCDGLALGPRGRWQRERVACADSQGGRGRSALGPCGLGGRRRRRVGRRVLLTAAAAAGAARRQESAPRVPAPGPEAVANRRPGMAFMEKPPAGKVLLDDTVPLTAAIEASQSLQSHTVRSPPVGAGGAGRPGPGEGCGRPGRVAREGPGARPAVRAEEAGRGVASGPGSPGPRRQPKSSGDRVVTAAPWTEGEWEGARRCPGKGLRVGGGEGPRAG